MFLHSGRKVGIAPNWSAIGNRPAFCRKSGCEKSILTGTNVIDAGTTQSITE